MSKIYSCFRTLYLIIRYGFDEAERITAKELKDEWHRRYKARLMEVASIDEKFAQQCLDAGMGEYDYDDDPEDCADSEMSYWEE